MKEVTELVHAPDKTWLDSYIWLPVTMKQFENLTNEIIVQLNRQAANIDQGFTPEYMAQVLTSCIHSLERSQAHIRRRDLYERCASIISRHISYHITEEHQKALKAQAGTESVAMDKLVGEPSVLPDEVRGQMPDAPQTVA